MAAGGYAGSSQEQSFGLGVLGCKGSYGLGVLGFRVLGLRFKVLSKRAFQSTRI